VKQLVGAIAEEGKPAMANRTLSWLSLFCRWAVEEEIIATNPCVGVKRPADEAPRELVLNDGELQAVLEGRRGRRRGGGAGAWCGYWF
jgi:site-specific recombinase XerC